MATQTDSHYKLFMATQTDSHYKLFMATQTDSHYKLFMATQTDSHYKILHGTKFTMSLPARTNRYHTQHPTLLPSDTHVTFLRSKAHNSTAHKNKTSHNTVHTKLINLPQ